MNTLETLQSAFNEADTTWRASQSAPDWQRRQRAQDALEQENARLAHAKDEAEKAERQAEADREAQEREAHAAARGEPTSTDHTPPDRRDTSSMTAQERAEYEAEFNRGAR